MASQHQQWRQRNGVSNGGDQAGEMASS